MMTIRSLNLPPSATLVCFALSTAVATIGCGSDATGTNPAPEFGSVEPESDAATSEPPARAPHPSFCPQSFARAENGGCEPILPSEPCAPDSLPVLGSSECRPAGVWFCPSWAEEDDTGGCSLVNPEACPDDSITWSDGACMDLGQCQDLSGPWFPPSEGGVVHYVDPSYPGSDSDGTWTRPWSLLWQAMDAAAEGDTIGLLPGSYEHVIINKSGVTLIGSCRSTVRLHTDGDSAVAVGDADRITVRNLTIDGNLTLYNGGDLLVTDVIVNGGSIRAVDVTNSVIERSAIQDYPGVGIHVTQSDLTIRLVDVRRAKDALYEGLTAGIYIDDYAEVWEPPQPSNVYVWGTVIDGAKEHGILAFDSDVQVVRSVIRNTQGGILDNIGIHALGGGRVRSKLEVTDTLVLNNETGIDVSGYDVELDSVVVRNPDQGKLWTQGISVSSALNPAAWPANTLSMSNCLVEGIFDYGVQVLDVDATIRNSIVRGIRESSGLQGVAVAAATFDEAAKYGTHLRLENSNIETEGGVALLTAGADVTADECWIHDTAGTTGHVAETLGTLAAVMNPDCPSYESALSLHRCVVDSGAASAVFSTGGLVTLTDSAFGAFGAADPDARRGRAVAAQPSEDVATDLTVDGCSFGGFSGATIAAHASRATVAHTTIGATNPSEDGADDGYGVVGLGGAIVEIEDTRIGGAKAAAVASNASDVRLKESELVCNEVDLALGEEPALLQGVACGCGTEDDWCSTTEEPVSLPELRSPN